MKEFDWLPIIREEAELLDLPLTNDEAGWLLWNETAFPFAGEAETRRQITEALEHQRASWRLREIGTGGCDA